MSKKSRYSIAGAARSAFTLIELLVVIAIVALLVAILLPGLAEARRAGKQAKNVTNMKGMGTAVQTYASDFKDNIPLFNRGISIPEGSNKLANPISDWGRKQVINTTQPGWWNNAWSYDVIDRVIGLSGGLSDANATKRGAFLPYLRYYPIAMANYLAGKLPDPSYVNPLDRVRSNIIGQTGDFLRSDSVGTQFNLGSDVQTIFCFSSSYEPNWGHLQSDRGPGLSNMYREDETGIPGADVTIDAKKLFGHRRTSEVIAPADKVFMFDRVARQSGRTPLPFRHPLALVTHVFWDSSVRVVRSSDMNIGGWVYGPPARPVAANETECTWDAVPEQGDDPYPAPVIPPGREQSTGNNATIWSLYGYHRWTMDGLRGRDVNGKQYPPGPLNP